MRTLLIVGSFLLSLIWGAPANAHVDLAGTNPKSGSVIAKLPPRIRLNFTEELTAPAYLAVITPKGKKIALGNPKIVGAKLIQPVKKTSENGRYQINYRVISKDGHPITGTIYFSVDSSLAPAPSPATTNSTPTPTSQPTATPTNPGTGQTSKSSPWSSLLPAALGAALGLGVFTWLRRRK